MSQKDSSVRFRRPFYSLKSRPPLLVSDAEDVAGVGVTQSPGGNYLDLTNINHYTTSENKTPICSKAIFKKWSEFLHFWYKLQAFWFSHIFKLTSRSHLFNPKIFSFHVTLFERNEEYKIELTAMTTALNVT